LITVEQLLQRLLNGESMKEICQTLGIAPSTIQRRLKKLGYEWNNSAKVWEWNHEKEQPLNIDLIEFTTGKTPGKKQVSNREMQYGNQEMIKRNITITDDYSKITNNHHEITEKANSSFTPKEIKTLKEMAAEYIETKKDKESAFFNRLRTLGKVETERKTVVMGKEVGEKLNEFAERYRVNRADVLTIALVDFFEKYDK
jgi:hypothetical protein